MPPISKRSLARRLSLVAITLRIGIAVASINASFLWAQAGSVATVDSDSVLSVNGRRVFPIGFSPGPPINGRTPTGDDALQEFRNAGAILIRMSQTTDW